MKPLFTTPFKALFLLLWLSLPAFATDYTNYCNDRFGFCVDYPSSFSMEPPPENDDGRRFHDRHGFQMTASGINNVLDATVASEMKSTVGDFDTVTYRKKGSNWYALSGYKGRDILYVKSYVGQSAINTLYLQYPKALKTNYDASVSRIVKSFVPGDLNEAH
ncbi:MAG: hypothetical protein PHE17_12735 [Thiothrix sp.]|uniref:hypothetical protein n=1 Tax=Thiothrix sp. TaxID=1032 RepID=UPI00260C286D|nr:hypothetical protein [Thiothrix sp.]MDD5393877.1 hypothetical protein [Thiothrix sp.]